MTLSPHLQSMACPALITPTPTSKPEPLPPTPTLTKSKLATTTPIASITSSTTVSRRHLTFAAVTTAILSPALLIPEAALAGSDEEYVKETEDVINKVRSTITLDKNDPKVADAVSELRATSNTWVAKYRRDKALLSRPSFRDIYSALNAVSGHYISFGPTAPIPAKRKARILEEMDSAEKALLRGR